jgi:hypothetical protein
MEMTDEQRVVDTKIKPFVGEKIKSSLGEADEDLVDFVLENIRDRKRPEDIIDGLDPVSYLLLITSKLTSRYWTKKLSR